MFYNYRQNNSGGYWIGPKNIIVEAESSEEADEIAQRMGCISTVFPLGMIVNVAVIGGVAHGVMTVTKSQASMVRKRLHPMSV